MSTSMDRCDTHGSVRTSEPWINVGTVLVGLMAVYSGVLIWSPRNMLTSTIRIRSSTLLVDGAPSARASSSNTHTARPAAAIGLNNNTMDSMSVVDRSDEVLVVVAVVVDD